MNNILASIYGTDNSGFDKTASESELDLDNISAAALLAGLEDGSIVLDDDEDFEKEAGAEDFDLSQLTGEELLALQAELDDEGEETLHKMANDGSFEAFDMAGRIMAHAFHQELMTKQASEEDGLPDFIDPSEIDAETMIELVQSGEYEIVDSDDMEKEAAKGPKFFSMKTLTGGNVARYGGKRREAEKMLKTMKEEGVGRKKRRKQKKLIRRLRGQESQARSQMMGAYGGAAGATTAAGLGTAALMNRNN